MLELKKGQIFKTKNNKEYVFLSYKNPNTLYCVDKNFYETNEIVLLDLMYVDEVLQEEDKEIQKLSWYYECKEEINQAKTNEKLDMLLNNMTNDFFVWENDLIDRDLKFKVSKIKEYVRGEAYCDITKETYKVEGFLVETETYENRKFLEKNTGFFAIYHSECNRLAPMTFFFKSEEDDNMFYNSEKKDYVRINEVVRTEEEINQYIVKNNYKHDLLKNKKTLEKIL